MMSLHKPYVITHEAAGQWATAMKCAIADVVPENAELGRQMGEILGDMAVGMGR